MTIFQRRNILTMSGSKSRSPSKLDRVLLSFELRDHNKQSGSKTSPSVGGTDATSMQKENKTEIEECELRSIDSSYNFSGYRYEPNLFETTYLGCHERKRKTFISASNCVLSVLTVSSSGLGEPVGSPVLQILKSLIWPFVARRSGRSELFSTKDYDRFVRSMAYTGGVLRQMRIQEVDREQSFVKFWLDTYLCMVFGDDQRPIAAFPEWKTLPLFKGFTRLAVLRAIARKDVSFIYSLQKGAKQMWPALGAVKKQSALDKHKARISEDRGPIPSDLESAISMATDRFFSELKSDVSPMKFIPSGSACLQASVRQGGALSLAEPYELPPLGRSLHSFRGMGKSGQPGTSSEKTMEAVKRIGKLPVLVSTLNQWRQTQFEKFEAKALNACTSINQESMTIDALKVKVVALPEPGKFRIITLGDGYLYSALQPLQGMLLDAWKRTRFSTMKHADLTKKVNEIERNCCDLPLWCSVDYEAATDLIKRSATLAVLKSLSDNVPQVWLARFCMEHEGVAEYPDGSTTMIREGQLMGHPLSFPLLCVINYAVYQCAITRWLKVGNHSVHAKEIARRMRRNVIVNGDDMLFKCHQSFYDVFLQVAAEAGFKISVGKNYLSADCALINSQVFCRSGDRMVRHGYLNLRLITGLSVKTGESNASPTALGKDLNLMFNLCPWSASALPEAFSRFSSDWHGWFRPNWFLPVHLGGYGIDPKWSEKGEIRLTLVQRRMAGMMLANPNLALYASLINFPLPLSEMIGAIAKFEMIPLSAPHALSREESLPLSWEDGWDGHNEFQFQCPDPWLARLAYAYRAAHIGLGCSPGKMFAKKYFKKLKGSRTPSTAEIELYRFVKFQAGHVPICPPLNTLDVVSEKDWLENCLTGSGDSLPRRSRYSHFRVRKNWEMAMALSRGIAQNGASSIVTASVSTDSDGKSVAMGEAQYFRANQNAERLHGASCAKCTFSSSGFCAAHAAARS